MKTYLFILAFILFPSLVNAKPVYLECNIKSSDSKDKLHSVKLDEETSKVTHTTGGNSFNADAFYAPKEISYKEVMLVSRDAKVTITYVIDRANLEFTQNLLVEAIDPEVAAMLKPKPIILKGNCKVIEIMNNKI